MSIMPQPRLEPNREVKIEPYKFVCEAVGKVLDAYDVGHIPFETFVHYLIADRYVDFPTGMYTRFKREYEGIHELGKEAQNFWFNLILDLGKAQDTQATAPHERFSEQVKIARKYIAQLENVEVTLDRNAYY